MYSNTLIYDTSEFWSIKLYQETNFVNKYFQVSTVSISVEMNLVCHGYFLKEKVTLSEGVLKECKKILWMHSDSVNGKICNIYKCVSFLYQKNICSVNICNI